MSVHVRRETTLVRVSGLLEADKSEVHVPYSAIIDRVLVKEGESVRSGQVLFTLDTSSLRKELAELEAVRLQETAHYRLAREKAANAIILAERVQKATNFAGIVRLEPANQSYIINLVPARSEDRTEHQWTLRIAQLEGRAAEIRKKINDGTVRSPVSGSVFRIEPSDGKRVSPEKPTITILNLLEMNAVFRVPHQEIARMQPGVRFDVSAISVRGSTISAEIEYIGSQCTDGLCEVRARLLDPAAELYSGLSFTATIGTPERPIAWVPSGAIMRNQKGRARLFVVVNGVIRSIDVLTGHEETGRTEILDSLEEGDRIVVTPERISAGERLTSQT